MNKVNLKVPKEAEWIPQLGKKINRRLLAASYWTYSRAHQFSFLPSLSMAEHLIKFWKRVETNPEGACFSATRMKAKQGAYCCMPHTQGSKIIEWHEDLEGLNDVPTPVGGSGVGVVCLKRITNFHFRAYYSTFWPGRPQGSYTGIQVGWWVTTMFKYFYCCTPVYTIYVKYLFRSKYKFIKYTEHHSVNKNTKNRVSHFEFTFPPKLYN